MADEYEVVPLYPSTTLYPSSTLFPGGVLRKVRDANLSLEDIEQLTDALPSARSPADLAVKAPQAALFLGSLNAGSDWKTTVALVLAVLQIVMGIQSLRLAEAQLDVGREQLEVAREQLQLDRQQAQQSTREFSDEQIKQMEDLIDRLRTERAKQPKSSGSAAQPTVQPKSKP
jgi:DNA-binding transcriptional MerR regulator